jgi:hypothetical protein
MIIVEGVFGVATTQQSVMTGQPGQVVTHSLLLTNTGTTTDSFGLTVTGQQWPTSLSLAADRNAADVTIGPLAAGAQAQLDFLVAIPTTGSTTSDTAVVTITSLGDPTQTAVSSLITNRDEEFPSGDKHLYLPFIRK